MAHEAIDSLNLIIETFLNVVYRYLSPKEANTYLDTAEIVQQELWSLKSILELDHFEESERLIALKGEILEAIPKFRDLLEDRINKSQSLDDLSSQEWIFDDKVRKETISFVETVKRIKEEYNVKDPEKSNKESPLVVPNEYFGGVNDEDLHQLITKLAAGQYSSVKIISVVGMAGIGKTTIVKALYNELGISDYFDCRAFLRVGPNYHPKDILLDLLVCLSPYFDKDFGMEKSEFYLQSHIHKLLSVRRYLIVLDDIWNIDVRQNIMRCFPDVNNGSRIVVTTRLSDLASEFSTYGSVYKIRFRNEKESWNLFCRKVFVPPGFENVGKKIVKKCEGLPLGIISIATILSKFEKTLDSWEMVAKNENLLALATEEGSPMSEALFLSYKHLPLHLKQCCLYFGVFPLNQEIPVSKLIKLWVGEGLVEPKQFKTFEYTACEYLEDLVSHNIVLVRQQSSSGITKTCSAQFFWHVLVREAANKKIFHLINSYSSAFSKGIHCQRRLCIHRNALLGFKRVSESIESVSNVRSFLCTGPDHQYPVSICTGSTALKVLDALTVRFYKFPIEILELVELKYLAFTYDGNLPSSISRLKNLVYLIVHRYNLTIINSSPSYMPMEIWNMQELKHLQVMGSDLQHPADDAQLPNLLTLLGVSDRSCTKEVLQSIPNLEKLGVRIVLPDCVSQTLDIFDHIALLSRLKSFKYIVPNPNPRSQQVLLLPKSVFPSSLTKLTLSGCGFAWEDMSMIGRALTNLRVLKLRCYAFQGKKWVVDEEFPNLEYLLLEDIDLVHWEVVCWCFPLLKRLIIRHCYHLKEIPDELEDILEVIELVDCNPSNLASAKHKLEWQTGELQVYSSLDDEKH